MWVCKMCRGEICAWDRILRFLSPLKCNLRMDSRVRDRSLAIVTRESFNRLSIRNFKEEMVGAIRFAFIGYFY